MKRPLVIFLAGAGWEARYQAVMLAVTAAALGDLVTLAVSFEPLRALVAGRFDEGAPPTAPAARVPPHSDALADARRELGLRVVACETAVRLAGLEPEAARAALDGLEPLPSLWRLAQAGRALSF
jgi:peroxiredoxin family protein